MGGDRVRPIRIPLGTPFPVLKRKELRAHEADIVPESSLFFAENPVGGARYWGGPSRSMIMYVLHSTGSSRRLSWNLARIRRPRFLKLGSPSQRCT